MRSSAAGFHRYAGWAHRAPTKSERPVRNPNRRRKFCLPRHQTQQEIPMRSKLAIPTLVVAALFGATTIASAQMQPAPGASSEGNVGPGATGTKMKSGKMKHSKMKSGTTTGMSSGSKKGELRNPSGQGNAGSGS